jgi:hypothetical protein
VNPVSWKLYSVAAASAELPHLAHGRVSVGAQVRHRAGAGVGL